MLVMIAAAAIATGWRSCMRLHLRDWRRTGLYRESAGTLLRGSRRTTVCLRRKLSRGECVELLPLALREYRADLRAPRRSRAPMARYGRAFVRDTDIGHRLWAAGRTSRRAQAREAAGRRMERRRGASRIQW